MALTALAKDELAGLETPRASARQAQTTALLRFAGGLHLVGGRIVIEAELDHLPTGRRLLAEIGELYGQTGRLYSVAGGALKKGGHYVLRIDRGAEALARQTGLLDARGRPVRGLPSAVVNGSVDDAAAALRGAFLARGSLTEPGRSAALEFTCPGSEAALALVGCARRLDVLAKARESRGADRVLVRDGAGICALLRALGATRALRRWEKGRVHREVRGTANRLANFDDANLRRSAQAAVTAGARVERALEILGDDVPEHLREAGRLRLEHRHASLDELGRLADPPLTKDAIAGRIRRLLALARRTAEAEQARAGEEQDAAGR